MQPVAICWGDVYGVLELYYSSDFICPGRKPPFNSVFETPVLLRGANGGGGMADGVHHCTCIDTNAQLKQIAHQQQAKCRSRKDFPSLMNLAKRALRSVYV